ncbi:hypothetical protein GCM10010383_36550 [Streptomyces lomondensis]|uniref:Uncharacterized protein n=1 Tax=Streptomyces lomondensis TaxID=68229 RepID=A0ABQ2X7I6_9ACTN|nr:hypothetical protein GCM10010383_36550 [Streptomyces lomondensis]
MNLSTFACPPPFACHRARHIPAVRRLPFAQPIPPRGELPCAADRKTGGQPPVTRPELGLYTISTPFGAPFCRVRSHWGSPVTEDTENNPLIGLPNQHIVGLTYVP